MAIFFRKANELKQEGKWEEAISAYSQVIERNIKFYWYHHNLGETLVKVEKVEEAIDAYNLAIKIKPNSAWSYHKLGEALELIDQPERAILSYRKAIELNPNFYGFYKSLGKALYQTALRITPEYLQKGKLDEVIYQPLSNEPLTSLYSLVDEEFVNTTSQLLDEDFLEILYGRYLQRKPDRQGKVYYLQLLDQGIIREELVAGIRNSPEFTSLLVFSVVSFLLKEAIVVHRIWIKLNPKDHKSYQNLSEVFNQLGQLLIQQGKLDEAIEIYTEALAIYHTEQEKKESFLLPPKLANLRDNSHQISGITNNFAWTYHHKGDALLQAGKIEEAIASYRKAIAINTSFCNPHLNLGYIFSLKNQLQEAINSYNQAIKLEPNWAYAHYSIGNVFLQNDQLKEASESYKKALAIEPNWGEAYCQLGNTLLQQGEIEEAIDLYNKAFFIKSDWNAWSYFAQETIPLFYRDCLEGRVQICQQALSLKPDWIEAYYEAGNWLYHCGHLESAIEFWSQCQQIQSELAEAHQIDTQGYRFFASDFTRNIGHLGLLDFHIKMDILGLRPLNNRAVIWAPKDHSVANRHLLNYWNEYIPAISDISQHSDLVPCVKYAEERIATVTPFNGKIIYYFHALATVQKQWEAEGRAPLLTLSDSDSKRGRICLLSLGVPKDAWFVCLHVRETNMMETLRVDSVRNADIDTYLLAMQSIVEQGGWVIRMGDKNMKPLPSMSQVIDYAHSAVKSDWMDVFLWSECRFFIGTNSGPFLIPPTFGIPCVITNWTPLFTSPRFSDSIFIPKLYWFDKEKRYLTLSEAISIPLGAGEYRKYYSIKNISVKDNTPDEINALVLEMLEQLEGKLEYTEQDERLQKQWENLIETQGSHAGSKMGRAFLRKYASLLA